MPHLIAHYYQPGWRTDPFVCAACDWQGDSRAMTLQPHEDLSEYLCPHCEDIVLVVRMQLVGLVEAAEHHPIARQPGRDAIGRRQDRHPRIGLEAVRQQRQRFTEAPCQGFRRGDRVADDVIGQAPIAQGADIAQPRRDHRGRPARNHAGTRLRGVTVQVDQQVEPVGGDLLRGLVVIHLQLHEPVRHGPCPVAPCIARARVAGIQHHFARIPVMGRDRLQHQEGDRMGAEIR